LAPVPGVWRLRSVKIDSCSEFLNMTQWQTSLSDAGAKPSMLLENCHNSDGQDPCPAAAVCPEKAICPYGLWRLGGDIGPSWGSVFHNLQDTLPWLGVGPLSRPGWSL
jgi:hypothetical protein